MRKAHLLWRIPLLLVLIFALALAGVMFYIGRAGSNPLQAWIGDQLISIVNSRLKPQLSFDDLDYAYPYTVSLKNLRLSAPDPANPGKMLDMLQADKATITLAKLPKLHKPIKIAQIVLDSPVCRLVSIKPGGSDLVGFSDMVKPDPTTTATTAPTAQAGDDQPFKLSDVLLIHLVQLNNGQVIYDPRLPGTEPMVFDHINTQIDVLPRSDGAYQLKFALDRQPLFNLTTAATLNIDTFVLSDLDLLLSAKIGAEKSNFLPPQVQQMIAEHQVRGSLRVHVTDGRLPLTSPADAVATLDATLVDANVLAGQYRIPISRLQLSAGLRDQLLTLATLDLSALQGTMTASAFYHLDETHLADLRLHIRDMQVENLFASATTASTDPGDRGTKYAGRLKADIMVNVPLQVLMSRFAPGSAGTLPSGVPLPRAGLPLHWGQGFIHMDHARLISLPVLRDISHALRAATNLLTDAPEKPRETVDARFDLMGDQIKVSQFDMASELIAGRGRGIIALDGRLDCIVNGGPVEKIQLLFGKEIGGFFGDITDRLYAYHVTGTINSPEIGVLLPGSGIIRKLTGSGTTPGDATNPADPDSDGGIFGGIKQLFGGGG